MRLPPDWVYLFHKKYVQNTSKILLKSSDLCSLYTENYLLKGAYFSFLFKAYLYSISG